MTNKELQELLKQYPDDLPVVLDVSQEYSRYLVLTKNKIRVRKLGLASYDADEPDNLVIKAV